MEDRFESSHFRSRRRAAARYLLDLAFVEDEKVEMEPFTRAAADVGGIFERLGVLAGARGLEGRIGVEQVRQGNSSVLVAGASPPSRSFVKNGKPRSCSQSSSDSAALLAELDRERGIAAPGQEILHQYMEYEAVIGEESPTTAE